MARIEPASRSHKSTTIRATFLTLLVLIILAAAGQTSAWAQGRSLALVVGISNYQDRAFEALNYAASDARRMAAYLMDPKGGGLKLHDVTLLLNQQATKANIQSHTRRIVRESRPQDTVVLYFSGHGAHTDDSGTGIVCYDSRSISIDPRLGPIALADSILVKEDLRLFLNKLKAGKRAVIMDVCYSAQSTEGFAHKPRKNGGYPPESEAESGPDPAAGPGSGEDQVSLILASCQGGERAWESRHLGASIFTYYLIKGLKIFKGDLAEAFYYSQERTQNQASQEKGWCQIPYMIWQPSWNRLIIAPPGKGDIPNAR
jgi:uncharacterized caspase-like protein